MGIYNGPLRLSERALNVNMRTPKVLREAADMGLTEPVIFIDHMNDLFARDTPIDMTNAVLIHCQEYPENTYIFQTKNPAKIQIFSYWLPPRRVIGCTIETDILHPREIMGHAPSPKDRAKAMRHLVNTLGEKCFITIEPIMEMHVDRMLHHVSDIHPAWVNIGADSKGHNLPEPTWNDVQELIAGIRKMGIEIRAKSNLKRLRN